MSDEINSLSPHAAFAAEKVSGASNQFSTKTSFQNKPFEGEALSEHSQDPTKTSIEAPIKEIEDPLAASGVNKEGSAEISSIKQPHIEAQKHLLDQLSMLSIPRANVPDPENVAAFQASFQALVDSPELCEKLTDPTFEPTRLSSFSSLKMEDQSWQNALSVDEKSLLKAHLQDPNLKSAFKMLALQPKGGNLETLALEIAVKNIAVSSSGAVQATKDAKDILQIQKDSNAEGLKSFQDKLDKSRAEMQKAMKNPVARWFSAIFKGIAGIVAGVFTMDPSIAMKGIASAHDDAIKAQYNPKNGKTYDYVLKKLGSSPFQAKWFKVLTSVMGSVAMAAAVAVGLPGLLKSGGELLGKVGAKRMAKAVADEMDGLSQWTKAGNKVIRKGEKLGQKSEALFSSLKKGIKKLATSSKNAADKEVGLEAKAAESELSAITAELDAHPKAKYLQLDSKGENLYSSTRYRPGIKSLINQSKRVAQLWGKHQTTGNALRGAITIVDQGENYVEQSSGAKATELKTQADVGMQSQRARYQRMTASISDLTTRVGQERASSISQAINVGSQMIKEIEDKKARIVSKRL